MTSCLNVRENICAYIDNELSPNERLDFEAHIIDCRECKQELDEMTDIIRLSTSLPQQELPIEFKSELHEKLLAVAGKQESNVKSINKDKNIKDKSITKGKSFLFTKMFTSIAAGILLIFLAGSFVRFGLFSPKMAKNSDSADSMATEMPAQQSADADYKSFGAAGIQESAVSPDQGVSFSASSGAVGNTEAERSIVAQDRNEAAALASGIPVIENVSKRISTITIVAENPNIMAEKVKLLAFSNNGESAYLMEEVSDGFPAKADDYTGEAAEAPATIQFSEDQSVKSEVAFNQLEFVFPAAYYEQFITALNQSFGAADVQIGPLVTEDLSDVLNNRIMESESLEVRMQELLEEDNTKNSEEITKLKKEKEAIDGQIEEMRLASDFIKVTVFINLK